MEKKFSGSKAATFLKKNGYYIIMAVCIVAIITLIGVAAFSQSNKEPVEKPGTNEPVEKPDGSDDVIKEDPIPKPVVFSAPVAEYTIGMDYSMDALVWHKSLDNWQVHRGIDFVTAQKANVLNIADGVVESVTNNHLDAQVVIIRHADGYTSVYKSLEGVTVTVGQTLKRGDILGKTSDSALSEVLEGYHVHLEITKNGNLIDPVSLIPIIEK